ncbi:hypothetical protein ACWC2K_24935 [Streptomyces chattanoogensis]
MPARDTRSGRLLPVRHLRPGGHALVGHGDDEGRRDAVTAFVRRGPARGGKVMVRPSPAAPGDIGTGWAAALGTAPARRLTVGQTRLRFLPVGCAAGLLALVHGAAGHPLAEVRCGRGHGRLPRWLVAAEVPRPAAREATGP